MKTPYRITTLLLVAVALICVTATGAETTANAAKGGTASQPGKAAADGATQIAALAKAIASRSKEAGADEAAVAKARAALAAHSRLPAAEAEARRRLKPAAFARWQVVNKSRTEAILEHLPALVHVEGYHAERVIYGEAFRLRDGGEPTVAQPSKVVVFAAARARNFDRYLYQIASREEILAAIGDTTTDWGCSVIDVSSRRLARSRGHTPVSRAMADAYMSRGLATGLTNVPYADYFRRRVASADNAEAKRLLEAEIAALEKLPADHKGAQGCLSEWRESLAALRELESYNTPSGAPTSATSAPARGAALAGLRVLPPSPGKYSPLWFRRQRLDKRRAETGDTPALAAAYAEYFADLAAASNAVAAVK
jgi:hypothetical protein